MAKNQPKKQHYVPQFYLRGFADPNIASSKEPVIWIFDKNGKNRRKDKVKNVLASNDLYTLKIKGQKDYTIEETLTSLEGKYAEVFRNKIKNRLTLTEEEHIVLCAFVSAMLQRTLRQKDNLEGFFDDLIEHAEALEQARQLTPKKSQELREFKKNIHKIGVVQLLPDITEILMQMSLAFLCTENGSKFITSDDPCILFNPDLQWQRLYSPGLTQKNVNLSLALSPEMLLCMSWSNLRGYIGWKKKLVEEANRMTVSHCYKYFVSNSPKTRWSWFRSYPMDFFYIMKIVKLKTKIWMNKWKLR